MSARPGLGRLAAQAWWDELETLEGYSFFATPDWARVLTATGYQCEAFVFESRDCRGLIPVAHEYRGRVRSAMSMPMGTYGGPRLLEGTATEDAELALNRQLLDATRVDHLSLTPGPYPHVPLPTKGTATTHLLRLAKDPEQAWKDLPRGTAREIEQARERGVEIRVGHTRIDFETYFEMLESSARRWGLAAPSHSLGLYHAIHENAAENARLWLADVEGSPAAGAICFYGKGEVFYWSGAMHKEKAIHRPNQLLQWHIIKDATARGLRNYNMGASGDLAGVQHFKEGFGATPTPYPVFTVTSRRYRAAKGLLRAARLGLKGGDRG